MIIVKLIGGLGNQLFQYAAARSLSIYHTVPLKLDITALQNSKDRKFELSYFNIANPIASQSEIIVFKKQNVISKLCDKILKPRYKRKIYIEPHFHFDKFFYQASSNTYLQGYWQSEKYFLLYKDIIVQDLTIKASYTEHLKEKAREIQLQNSVAIHIRRGDYNQPKLQEYHGLLEASYYNNAIDYLLSLIPDIKIYFFSDDPIWVKSNIQIQSNSEFISGTLTKNHIEDFYLMSQCKHNIIANSSFSWWAAWLNNNPNKIVIAPKKWFNKAKHNTSDLIPDTWIRF